MVNSRDLLQASYLFKPRHSTPAHTTNYSTLKPSCLPSGSAPKAEAVDFFNQVVTLFKTLPTYTFLSNQGITPTNSKTFTLSQLTSALKSETVGHYPIGWFED
jgi:ribonuclease T2